MIDRSTDFAPFNARVENKRVLQRHRMLRKEGVFNRMMSRSRRQMFLVRTSNVVRAP